MTLSKKQLSFLRSKAHPLDARLKLGKQGTSDGFLRELRELLVKNELVKVRLGKLVEVDLEELARTLEATLVQKVGRSAVFYKPAAEPVLRLPK